MRPMPSMRWCRPPSSRTRRSSAPTRGSKNCRRSSAAASKSSSREASSTVCAKPYWAGASRAVGTDRALAGNANLADGSAADGPEPGYPPQMPTGPAFGSGGSFLGTAASTAAGVIGGALLMDGICSIFGHHTSAELACPRARSDALTTIGRRPEAAAHPTAIWHARPGSMTSTATPGRIGRASPTSRRSTARFGYRPRLWRRRWRIRRRRQRLCVKRIVIRHPPSGRHPRCSAADGAGDD